MDTIGSGTQAFDVNLGLLRGLCNHKCDPYMLTKDYSQSEPSFFPSPSPSPWVLLFYLGSPHHHVSQLRHHIAIAC